MSKNTMCDEDSDYDRNDIKNEHTRRISCIHRRYHSDEGE
jgi:hypothetical protein